MTKTLRAALTEWRDHLEAQPSVVNTNIACKLDDLLRRYPDPTPRMVVTIEGGHIQDIIADRPMQFLQLDWDDSLECGVPDEQIIESPDGSEVSALIRSGLVVDPATVRLLFTRYEEKQHG